MNVLPSAMYFKILNPFFEEKYINYPLSIIHCPFRPQAGKSEFAVEFYGGL